MIRASASGVSLMLPTGRPRRFDARCPFLLEPSRFVMGPVFPLPGASQHREVDAHRRKSQGLVLTLGMNAGDPGYGWDMKGRRDPLTVFPRVRKDLKSCPKCRRRLPVSRRPEGWVQQPLGDGWVASYRLMVKEGRPVIAEVRIHLDDGRGQGNWSEAPADLPGEGVPAQALRRLGLKVAKEQFAAFHRELERDREFATLVPPSTYALGSALHSRRPGRKGHPESFYVLFALAYLDRLGKGSAHPIKDLAARPPVRISGYVSGRNVTSEASVRDIIHQARRKGFLTSSPPGRAGGHLTPKAKQAFLEQIGLLPAPRRSAPLRSFPFAPFRVRSAGQRTPVR